MESGTAVTGTRYLLYSHDGAGLGHTRRNLAIAAAVTRLDPSAAVLLATGSQNAGRLGLPPGVDFLKLPGLRKEKNGRYVSRHLAVPPDEVFRLRAAILEATARTFCPDVTLIDKHPLGAHRELVPSIQAIKQFRGRLVLGLRDILDEPTAVRQEWHGAGIPEIVDRMYDQILVYGSPRVLDPIKEYGLSDGLADRTHFCGYVVHEEGTRLRASDIPPSFLNQPHAQPVVLATVGGGEDGFPLLDAFIQAAAQAPWRGVVVTGPLACVQDRLRLTQMAERAELPVYTMVGGLAAWFSLADAVVCMGGYNTVVEAVSSGTPTVCVPRVMPRSEQLIRAEAFADLGLLRVVHPRDLTAANLGTEIDITLRQSRTQLRSVANRELDFQGAAIAARRLLDLAASNIPIGKVG